MKNFVIATVSMVALLGASANAQENPHEMTTPPAEHAGGEHPGAEPAAGEHVVKHRAHKHHARKHHGGHCAKKKRHKHHKHHAKKHCGPHHRHHMHGHRARGHAGPLAVFVNFPPVDCAALSASPCDYYQGNQQNPYIYHEGYYWYPQARADLLPGYAPHEMRGSYWYPSRMHPKGIYEGGQAMFHPEIYPVQMGAEMGLGLMEERGVGRRHHRRAHHAAAHRHHRRHHGAVAHHGAAAHHMASYETGGQSSYQRVAYTPEQYAMNTDEQLVYPGTQPMEAVPPYGTTTPGLQNPPSGAGTLGGTTGGTVSPYGGTTGGTVSPNATPGSMISPGGAGFGGAPRGAGGVGGAGGPGGLGGAGGTGAGGR